ncbi:MAG: hypothetical protein ACRDG4_08165, partial [Chloroflexota bacterium]
MQDDARADLLFRLLAGEEPLPGEQDDEELRALAGLGARLETLRPAMAALGRAEQAFNPAFAQGLHRTLVAAHPAAPPERAAAHTTARATTRVAKRLSRRLLALAVLLVTLVIIAAAIVIQGNRQTVQVGTAALTATAARPHIMAKSFAANVPQPPVPAGGTARTAAPNATMAPSFGAAPPAHGGAHPTPSNAQGTESGSNIAGPRMDTIAPRALLAPESFRYQFPSTLPARPVSVPLYRVRRMPITTEEAQTVAASFAGMHGMTGTALLSFSGGGARLMIDPTIGTIDFISTKRAPTPTGATTPLPDSKVVSDARAWLNAHHLLPKQLGQLTVEVARQEGRATVRFAPTLPLPLVADA